MRINQARMALQQNTAEAVAALVTDEIPESMIENEINARIQDLVGRLQQQGMDVGRISKRSVRLPRHSPTSFVDRLSRL